MAPRRLGYATVGILRAIDDGHTYGLDIIAGTDLPSGTVYVTLGRLEDRGFLRSRWEEQSVADREGRPRRRYYELTREGRSALERALARYGELLGAPSGGTARS